MKFLITGSNGLVARAAFDNCRLEGDDVSAFTRQELDISDLRRVEEIFQDEKPEIVLNCAAYTDVDGSESNVEKCYAANAVGVENLALAARKIDAAFVTISTDYILTEQKPDFTTSATLQTRSAFMAKRNSKAKSEPETLTHVRLLCVRAGFSAISGPIF